MKLPRFAKVYHIKNYNFTLAALVLSLSVLGIFVVGSAREIYQSRQILGVAIGLCVMFVISLFDYVWVLEFEFFQSMGLGWRPVNLFHNMQQYIWCVVE